MNEYVVVRLITGETLMAILTAQDEDKIELYSPVVVRAIQIQRDGRTYEQTVTNAFCPYTEDQDFVFENTDILFVKPLHRKIIPFYQVMVGVATMKEDDIMSQYVDPPDDDEAESKVFH